jgi:hypothetical protein
MAGKTLIKILMLLALVAMAAGCSDDDPAAPAAIDTAPPAVPTNLTADYAGQGTVILSWDPNTVDTDLAGYVVDKVYRGETVALVASPIAVPTWQDPAVGTGVTTYRVYSVDHAGNESAVAVATISLVNAHPAGELYAH